MPTLLLLLCFYFSVLKLNASGSWAMIESVQVPNPEGGLEIFQLFPISPMQNLKQIIALLSVETFTSLHMCHTASKMERNSNLWRICSI